ncbi:unnamed protein product [Cladocopium goreaui]|uniref:Uncharacterized protein n=1 Tax=Cladocopium goreaui TaxID=2562237 RepID=A0A9P1D493_9DINO|nr:unnamed protein product [Cladocopium goreaui]
MAVPSSLRLLGRPSTLENSDICGLYVHSGWNEGRATYLQVGTNTALYFRNGTWVVDRYGVRDSDLAAAWAKDHRQPTPLGLAWSVWKSGAKDFVADQNLQALDAPDVTFISRRADISGEYTFAGVSEGYPYYSNGDMLIRYHHEGRKWLVAGTEHKGNNCIAYAEAQETMHPGYGFLKWHVWNASTGQWNADANCHCLAAPSVIHVLGRHPQACNARICGAYHLVGVREGRPLYLLPGKKAVIRYAPESDRWLIDFDALAEPGILGRILQWAFNGSEASDACSAYADARGSSHPGHVDLEWHIWENSQNRAVLDPCVRATSAPWKLHVSGRGQTHENGDICGEYLLVGLHKGWPAYQKPGVSMAIRREKSRWVIDREGLRDSLTCVAYASATPGFEHPGDGGSRRWHVYESCSGCHALDLAIQIRVDDPGETSGGEPNAKRQRMECPVTTSHAHFGA